MAKRNPVKDTEGIRGLQGTDSPASTGPNTVAHMISSSMDMRTASASPALAPCMHIQSEVGFYNGPVSAHDMISLISLEKFALGPGRVVLMS